MENLISQEKVCKNYYVFHILKLIINPASSSYPKQLVGKYISAISVVHMSFLYLLKIWEVYMLYRKEKNPSPLSIINTTSIVPAHINLWNLLFRLQTVIGKLPSLKILALDSIEISYVAFLCEHLFPSHHASENHVNASNILGHFPYLLKSAIPPLCCPQAQYFLSRTVSPPLHIILT